MTEKEKTAPVVSVGADTEQSILKQTNNSITDFNEKGKSLDDYLEEMQKEFLQQLDPSHLKTISMRELYNTVYQSKPPLIDGLLYPGTYIFAGAPKLGKSFLMAQLAYHISSGTHEKHLSVLDYKKQERATELEELGAKIEVKQAEFNVLSERVLNYDDGLENLRNVEEMLDNAPEYQLSEPQGFMSVKAYKTKIAEPLIQKLKALIKTALARCFEGWDSYHRLNITNGNLYRENEMLSKINSKLKSENENLRSEVKDYKLLRKVFGHKQIDELLEQARNIKGRKRENPRSR